MPTRRRFWRADGVAEARALLDGAYTWLDHMIAGRAWAAGSEFTIGDCAAAPALIYADWVHPIGDRFPAAGAYRSRILARPSVARVVDEARPFRNLFPGGAPERD
jgi:glutathione S-transferase